MPLKTRNATQLGWALYDLIETLATDPHTLSSLTSGVACLSGSVKTDLNHRSRCNSDFSGFSGYSSDPFSWMRASEASPDPLSIQMIPANSTGLALLTESGWPIFNFHLWGVDHIDIQRIELTIALGCLGG